MGERDYAPLSAFCVRALSDKMYDKRKVASQEIEKMVRAFYDASNESQINKLLRVLGQEFANANNPNFKKGGLLGLSSAAVALGKNSASYLPELINPILACFTDSDIRVRYHAVEAMYNVVKVVRGQILTYFPEIFNALSKLATDSDMQVKQGSELLDKLMKDIVTESASFDLATFIPLLQERIYSRNSFGRQFIISWVSVLDAVPDIDLIIFLPEILDGLFKILDDPMIEIKKMCDTQLGEFLRSIKKDPSRVDFARMINTLIIHAQSSDETLQFTAVTWIKEFVQLSGAEMLPYLSGILIAVLPCLSYNGDSRRNIKETASAVNYSLMKLISLEPEEGKEMGDVLAPTDRLNSSQSTLLDLPPVVEVLSQHLRYNSVQTKVAVLKWILHLYNKIPTKMFKHTDQLFSDLLVSLTDNSDDVVRQSLAVLAEICSSQATPLSGSAKQADLGSNPYYKKFLVELLTLLSMDEALLEDRGAFIVRQLCVLLNAEDIYRTLSEILLVEKKLDFASTMVDILNTILLTSAELYDLRTQLKEINTPESRSLFVCLYECWAHSPVPLAALCLLTHNYAHCNTLIKFFGDLEITVDFLTEIDKLVQLIESPIFAYLRLELLGGGDDGGEALRGALYGLLMLLPQTESFHTLRRRLQCAPRDYQHHTKSSSKADNSDIPFDKLLQGFLKTQATHRVYKLTDRTKKIALLEKEYL